MAPPRSQTEPIVLVVGDTWTWSKSLANYPPSEGWVLGYAIRGASALANTKVSVVVDGGSYVVTILPADTAKLVPGSYRWQSFVDKAGTGEHYTVETGVFTVVPSLSQAQAGDATTHAERMLGALEREIEARLTGNGSAHESYAINGRSIAKIPMEKLIRLRAIYQAKVYRLQNPGQLGPTILAEMNNPDGTIGTSEPVVLPPWYRALVS